MKDINTQANETVELGTTTVTVTTAATENEAALASEAAEATKNLISNLLHNSAVTSARVVQTLEHLEFERKNWESNEMAASHARLYAILTRCYEFYSKMKDPNTPKEVRSQMAKGLTWFVEQRGFKTLAKTHDINRVVKAVFGEDRRRVSAYAAALRVALTGGPVASNGALTAVPAANLATWIAANGGVEEVRKASTKSGITTKERVETAQAAVRDKPLMSFKPDTKAMQFDADDGDRMMVLVVTYRPTGDLEVNSVVKSEAVLKAALAAHYAANKDAMSYAQSAASPVPRSAVSIALDNNT